MKKLSWSIIGAGQIAGGFDRPESAHVLTHIKALKRSVSVDKNRISIVEPDSKKSRLFCKKWGISKSYVNINELLKVETPNAISVCTPPGSHESIIRRACGGGVRVILCEKPLASSYSDALSIIKLCRKSGVKLIVNYPRRFDPVHLRAIELVKAGCLGKIQAVTGYYTKGLLNNGSHFINLLRALFGKITEVRNLGGPFSKDFPYESPDFMTKHRGAECLVRALDHRNYMLFELDIIGKKGRVRLVEKGRKIKWYVIAGDPIYKGYKALRLKETIEGTFDKMMFYVVDSAIKSYFVKNDAGNSMMMNEAAEDIFSVEQILKKGPKDA